MGNIVTTIKRFLSNKNTVTILGVLLGLVVLFIGYNYRIKNAVETITIPYAKTTINSSKAITSDMVGEMEVLKKTVDNNKNLISNMSSILNVNQAYCVSERTTVPTGSFFYTEQIKPCNQVNSNPIKTMPEGYSPIAIPADLQSTYGNTMVPGDYIDLYVRMEDDQGLLIFGKLLSKLPIADVRDSNGTSIYYGTNQNETPAMLLFGVPEEYFLLIGKANLLGSGVVELIPVPGNAEYSEEKGETRVESEYLRNEILKHTAIIPDESVRPAE